MFPAYAALAALALFGGCASPQRPLATAGPVDLQRYYGTWYEIARLPNRFQSKCVSDVRAHYAPDDGGISVVNSCRTRGGQLEQAEGVAHLVAGSMGSKLRVSFFRPFYGDYWILALDPDYRWVLVGEPARRYAWVLARTPELDEATRERLLAQADALGFPRRSFIRTRHTEP